MFRKLTLLLILTLSLTAFSCENNISRPAPSGGKATLQLSARLAESPEDPLGHDAYAIINNQRYLLGSAGSASVPLDAGTYDVLVIEPGASSARTQVTLAAGEQRSLSVTLASGFGAVDYQLALTAPSSRILSPTAPQLRIEARNSAGAVLAINRLDHASVRAVGRRSPTESSSPTALGSSVNLTTAFAISDNAIVLVNGAALVSTLTGMPDGSYLVELAAYDNASGIVYEGGVLIELGDSSLNGRILPGATGASPAGATVRLQVLGADLEFSTTSSADGSFAFPLLPTGNVLATVEVNTGSRVVTSQELIFLSGATQQDLILAGIGDFVNTATVSSRSSSVGQSTGASDPRRALLQREGPIDGSGTPRASVFSPEAITVTGAAKDVPVRAERTYQVAGSATSVTVMYEVSTLEYPQYVQSQSIYNDTWSISVRASNGQPLKLLAQSVNAQLRSPPVWRGDGSTGEQQLVVDLSSVPAVNGQKSVTIAIQTKNIGDSALATTVRAEVGSAPFHLETGSLSTLPPGCLGCRSQSAPSMSIPNQGQSNAFDRTVEIRLVPHTTEPINTSQITRVKITAQIGANSFPIFDSPTVPNVESPTTFLAPVSFRPSTSASPFSAPPPLGRNINYIIEVTRNGQTVSVSTQAYTALWRAASSSRARLFSDRELPGGDDWASFEMFNWLLANHASLPSQNDISGEHGQDLGHLGHLDGRKLDVFLFGPALGGPSGRANQIALEGLVIAARGSGPGATAAQVTLRTWLTAHRAGIASLCADPSVTRIRGTLGRALEGIAAGWGEQLILSGRISMPGNTFLTIIAATFSCEKYVSDNIHDNHNHIEIG